MLLKLTIPVALMNSLYLSICGLQRGKHYPSPNLSILGLIFTENDIKLDETWIYTI